MAVAVGTIVDGPVKDGSSDSVRTVLSPGGIIKESGGSSVLIRLEHSWRWELGVSGVVGLCWSCAGLVLVLCWCLTAFDGTLQTLLNGRDIISHLLKISISDITLENGRAIVLIGGKAELVRVRNT